MPSASSVFASGLVALALCGSSASAEFSHKLITRELTIGRNALVAVDMAITVDGDSSSPYQLPNEVLDSAFDTLIVTSTANPKKKLDLVACSGDAADAIPRCLASAIDGVLSVHYIQSANRESLRPHPSKMDQLETQQLLLHLDTQCVQTTYKTESQSTKIKLPSTGRFTSGSKASIGPFKDGDSACSESNDVLFIFDTPLLRFTEVHREVRLSQWGPATVEEHWEVRNDAVSLLHGFSRLDFQQKQERNPAGGYWISHIETGYPKPATDLFYRDEIGNISTSILSVQTNSLTMKPRFPMLGGWRSKWYWGYSVPAESILFKRGDESSTTAIEMRDIVKFPVKGTFVEKMVVQYILPEGSTVVSTKPELNQAAVPRYAYLDTPDGPGRAVLELTLYNVSSAGFELPVVIQFNADPAGLIRKPLVATTAFLAVYLCYIVFSRL